MYDIDNNTLYTCADTKFNGVTHTLQEGVDILCQADLLIGHNILGFDIPAIEKLYNVKYKGETYDTLIASKLKYTNLSMSDANNRKLPPKLKGSHSLGAWGYRLKLHKGDHNDWTKLSQDMIDYCIQDVRVTYKLYDKLSNADIPDEAMYIEQAFKKIIMRQEQYGWKFDVNKARELHVELLREKDEVYDELLTVFKPIDTWMPKPYPKVAFKKDGSKSQVLLSQEANGYHFNDDMEWGRLEAVEFNPQSVLHRVKFIDHYFGKQKWELNENGNPKTGESDLLQLLEGNPLAEPLIRYLNITKLLGQLAEGKGSWLNAVIGDRIHGQVDTLGAVSRRCTHSKPNVAQVPSSRAYKGKECRELFIVSKGKKLVGCDADGLELRTLSHYMASFDGGEYAKAVDEGKKEEGTDIHTLNQRGAGLPTRDDAKTFIYAFLYGAGDGKIGSIIGGSSRDGKRLKEKFFEQIPAIKQLTQYVSKYVTENRYLPALDWNKYHIRSPHSALNILLQGAGALVMKYYNVFADENFQKRGWIPGVNYEQVGSIHDECQWEVDEDIAEEFARVAERSFNDVTDYLKFKCPLRGSADIGDSWYDTH